MTLKTIDFLRPVRAPFAGWCILAVGALPLGVAKWCDERWTTERRMAEEAQLAAVDARRAVQRPVAPPVPSATERRLQQARTELRRPWLASLRSIESAAVDPVYLLALSFEPTTGAIKLEAEAPSFEHALAFTQVLADGVTLPSATLASHEQVADATAVRPTVRFTVLTRWNAP
ncbi:MAG: hypothetical protein KF754_16095 [Planctomycetes bacterium]|nr:hypothetical protein [Planctomycetota bacterium]